MKIDVTPEEIEIPEWPAEADMQWLVTNGPAWKTKAKYKKNNGDVAAMFYSKADAINYRGINGGRVWLIGSTAPLEIEIGG